MEIIRNIENLLTHPLDNSISEVILAFQTEEDRIRLNTPDQETVAKIISRERNYVHFFRIPQLMKDDPELHERYMELRKAKYYFLNNIETKFTRPGYIKEKFIVYSLITDWAREYYNRGEPKITNMLYDYFKQHRTRLVNFDKDVVLISEKYKPILGLVHPPPLDTPLDDLWENCARNYYKLDVLEEENNDLHERYLKFMKIRYYWFAGITTHTDEEYTKMKSDVILEIVSWNDKNRILGKKGITDSKRCYLLDMLKTRTFIVPNIC